MESSAVSSYEELLQLLERDGVSHQAEPDTKSVRIPTRYGEKGVEGVQLIRWQNEQGIVEFIQSLPLEVAKNRLAALESALSRLNHALPWPGLDLSHEQSLLAYRLVLPLVPRGSVTAPELKSLFSLAVKTAAELLPTLRRVIAGETAPEAVVADVEREHSGTARAAAKPEPSVKAPAIFRVD